MSEQGFSLVHRQKCQIMEFGSSKDIIVMPSGRKCTLCTKRLSKYNQSNECFSHKESKN